MFGEVSEHSGGVRNVSESERNGSDHLWNVPEYSGRVRKIPGFRKNHIRKVSLVGPTWQVGHMGPLGAGRNLGGEEESLWDSNSPLDPNWEGRESH